MSDTKISKKSWNGDEDSLLLQLVNQYGLNGHWSTISSRMGNRTGKQCRERYHNHLKPDIWKGTWSQEEDDLLNESQKTMGNQWAKIAKLLPGRSDNSVKNRWHIINRKKNATEEYVAACVSVDTSKQSKPLVPKLALGNLSSAYVKPPLPEIVEQDCDLMSFYYSHDSHEHCHRATDSTRSNNSIDQCACPGSGRRDYSTEAGPAEAFDDEFDCDDAFDALLDDARNTGLMSFNNTLSSCISELTTNSSGMQDPLTPLEDCDSLSARSACWKDTIHSLGRQSADGNIINIDRFSEAALSFRDMESVLDDLANDEDAGEYQLGEDDDDEDALFMFDLMDKCTQHNTAYNASPVVRSGDKQQQQGHLNRFVNMLQQFNVAAPCSSNGTSCGIVAGPLPRAKSSSASIRDFSPRTTPRSPLCPQPTKRQRAGRTPRSPYQLMLRVI